MGADGRLDKGTRTHEVFRVLTTRSGKELTAIDSKRKRSVVIVAPEAICTKSLVPGFHAKDAGDEHHGSESYEHQHIDKHPEVVLEAEAPPEKVNDV